jgi:hypothetical protein
MVSIDIWKPPTGASPPKSTTKSKNSSSSKSSSSKSGSGSSDPYARARADQKAAESKAAARLAAQGDLLMKQAAALKLALGSKGFRAELNRQLAAANLEFSEEDKLVLAQYERGKSSLEQSAVTSGDNRARSLQENAQNTGRERNEALAQGIQQGISATDMLKAQSASLRNWSLNANQVQTNYTDENNSIQSEHSQMVNAVVSARQGSWREREQQRTQAFRTYYDNFGQVQTEVGNKLGEASASYDMAYEQKASKAYKKKSDSAEKTALAALRSAALQTGKGYTERATPTTITRWEGSADIKNSTDPRQWGDQSLEIKDAEGASSRLRKWEG